MTNSAMSKMFVCHVTRLAPLSYFERLFSCCKSMPGLVQLEKRHGNLTNGNLMRTHTFDNAL